MIIAVSVLLLGTAAGLIYYWIDFYSGRLVQVVNEDWYIKFQKSFTVADLWTAACAILGAVGLIMGQTFGLVLTLIAAGSLIFLGLMDITFNVQNNLYRLVSKSGQMKFEVFINLWTVGLGIAFIVLLWPYLSWPVS